MMLDNIIQLIPDNKNMFVAFEVDGKVEMSPIVMWALVENEEGKRHIEGVYGSQLESCSTCSNFIGYFRTLEEANDGYMELKASRLRIKAFNKRKFHR